MDGGVGMRKWNLRSEYNGPRIVSGQRVTHMRCTASDNHGDARLIKVFSVAFVPYRPMVWVLLMEIPVKFALPVQPAVHMFSASLQG
jgi:hypothetical protein